MRFITDIGMNVSVRISMELNTTLTQILTELSHVTTTSILVLIFRKTHFHSLTQGGSLSLKFNTATIKLTLMYTKQQLEENMLSCQKQSYLAARFGLSVC